MPFNYTIADFVAFTKIKSADVNSRFADIKTFLNGAQIQTIVTTPPNNGVLATDGSGTLGYVTTGLPLASPALTSPAIQDQEVFTNQGSDPSTPASGKLAVYSKNKKLYTKDDAGTVQEVGSGAGSNGVNYIANPSASVDTAGWATYNDSFTATITIASPGVISATAHGLLQDDPVVFTTSGALPTGLTAGTTYYVLFIDANSFNVSTSLGGAAVNTSGTQSGTHTVRPLRPIDATGGTAITTLTRNTSSPIRGAVADFLITKDAADRSGEGVAYAFTLDTADKGKVLTISIDDLPSAAFADGDLNAWVYDVTNSVRIPVTPQSWEASTYGTTFLGEFQAPVNSTSLRLCIHIASANGNAWTLHFTNASIGPAFIPQGTPITDWQPYTLAITGVTTNPGLGTVTYNNAQYRRVGDSIQIRYQLLWSTLGTAGSGSYRFSLPPGVTIDTSKVSITASDDGNRSSLGTAEIFDGDSNFGFVGSLFAATSTTLGLTLTTGSGNVAVVGSGVYPLSMSSGSYNFTSDPIPVAGWSSNLQMASDADTRVVSLGVQDTSGLAITTSPAVFIYPSVLNDTHAVYNPATGLATIRVPGRYRFSAKVTTTPVSLSAAQFLRAQVYKNGVSVAGAFTSGSGGTNTFTAWVFDAVDCAVGDTLGVYVDASVSTTALTSAGYNTFTLEKLSGPSKIAASEKVYCSYNTATAAALTTAYNLVTFSNKDQDTHNAYASGIFTCPKSATFTVHASIEITGGGTTAATIIAVYKNGVIYRGHIMRDSIGGSYTYSLSADVPCLIGDTLAIYAYTEKTTANFVYSENASYLDIKAA